jgi:hypothetical protein
MLDQRGKDRSSRLSVFYQTGMNANVCATSEWVDPRWSSPRRKSMSEITEAKKSRGMLIFVLKSLDAAFLVRYPKTKCPTANTAFSSVDE